MRWLQKSSQAPQLIGLSPLNTDDSLSISNHSINLIEQQHDMNYETNQSSRKSRKDFSSFRTLTWSKKFAKSTENCYNIQEGRVIDRSSVGQCDSPVRSKNINFLRSSSPSNQSISSIKTISTSTPTYFTTLRRLHRHKLANVLDFDKEVWRNNYNSNDVDNLSHCKSISSIIDEDICHKDFNYKSELNRTFCGAYGVPYREKRNPLNHTRLSCYKPIKSDQFDIQKNLKNFKSVDDFLSIDMNNEAQSSTNVDQNNDEDETKMNELYSNQKHKRKGLSSKFRTMSDKTQKLFSKLYSNSSLKTSTAETSNYATIRPNSGKIVNSRRSLSYGALTTQIKEFEAKKVETEDCDSGILINESGASSMTDENSETNKKGDHVVDELFKIPPERKYVQRIEIKYDEENIDEERNEPKICSSSFNKQNQHNVSCSDLSLTPVIEKRQKNRSVDSGLNHTNIEAATKRNSVIEIVAMLEKNDNNTKFNTLNNPRRSKGTSFVINQEEDSLDSSALNMCDDDKLMLKTAQSKEKIDDNINDKHSTPPHLKKIPSTNFCTLPRKAKTSPHCTFHTVIFEKGPGKKGLGFTIVGGADSPRGALGIFIKSIMPKGQAVESGLLRAGDEVLAVNGHVCHDLTHQDAIKLFKSVKSGEIVLNICRRKGSIAIT